MPTVDDPMLALIVRFVTQGDQLDFSDEEFARRQVVTLKSYVDRYPETERRERALQWVEKNAEAYRREWQRTVVSTRMPDRRCGDCPLIYAISGERTCVVHRQWLELLKKYIAEKIDSREYIEQALSLLQSHKDELKMHAQQPLQAGG